MPEPPSSDTAFLERFSRVLQELGYPASASTKSSGRSHCSPSSNRDAPTAACWRRPGSGYLLLRQYRDYLDGLDGNDATLDPDDLAAHAETFRVTAAAAGEGAASLEALFTLHSRPST